MKIIIMAGGGGTRLWPLSREKQPKQFSHILGDKTLFEQTVERFLLKYKAKDIFVCLNKELSRTAKKLCPQLLAKNYIIEPERRDTGPAMGYVAAYLMKKFASEPIAFVPSDHFIGNEHEFLKIIEVSDKLIRETGKMVDIAIEPSFPSTVLGYTHIGKKLFDNEGLEIFEFLGHKEKPDFNTARKYLKKGDYLWHASYYMWTPRLILAAFAKHSPKHFAHLEKIIGFLGKGLTTKVAKEFGLMDRISFDYAVTEKIDPREVLIFKGNFGWSDVGAFDVLYESQKVNVDENNNIIMGDSIVEDTTYCYIHSGSKRLVATVGLSDLVIVDTPDVLLICPRGKAQEVKKIVQKLKDNNQQKYL